jgi:hypothetical protein
MVLLGLLTVLAVGAVASASASATAVMPAYAGLANNTHLTIENLKTPSSGNAKLEGTLAGLEIEILCSQENGSGYVENSEALGMGHSLGELHYLSCSIKKPAGQGCLVSNSLILVKEVLNLLLLHEGSGFYLVDFSPESGTTFTSITIDGCTNTSLNNTFKVNGTARGLVNNSNSSVNFSSTTGSKLTLGGNPATYTDEIQFVMAGGEALKVIDEK